MLQRDFEIPTWEQINEMFLSLSSRIRKDGFRPDVIVGVSHGGWASVRILSDLLGNPYIVNIKVEFYLGVDKTKTNPVITQSVSVKMRSKKSACC